MDKVVAAMPGHHFMNEGVNGDTSLNLYRRVDEDVVARRPDGVLVMVGGNDAISFSVPASRLYYRLIKRIPSGMVSPISFRENLRAVLGKLVVAQVQVWVALPPLEFRPEAVETMRKLNAYAREVCQELKVPTLDLFTPLVPDTIPLRSLKRRSYLLLLRRALNKPDYETRRKQGGYSYSFDGIHLTERGAQVIADEVVLFLRANGVV